MLLHPYFVFNGQARAAIQFYAQALDLSHSEIKTYGESPVPHDPKHKDWVMHCELIKDGKTFAMLADSPDIKKTENANVQLSINYEDIQPMEIAFAKLSEKGTITMPLAKQFWNATFGTFTDQFGIHWMMNCDHTTP